MFLSQSSLVCIILQIFISLLVCFKTPEKPLETSMTAENFFAVVDPTINDHVALERAITTAKLMDIQPKMCVFVAVDAGNSDTSINNTNITRDTSWFEEKIHKPLKKAQIEYQIEISWAEHWQKAVIQSAKAFNASRILVPANKPKVNRRLYFSEFEWKLLKRAFCPVVLVRAGGSRQRKVVLAAVNFQARRPRQKELNKSILTKGRMLAKSYDADFHVINAYMDSMSYPDRGILAREAELKSSKIHVVQGYTDEVIGKVARELSADVVVVGTLGQSGQVKNLRGNTVERVISAIEVDVVIVNSG